LKLKKIMLTVAASVASLSLVAFALTFQEAGIESPEGKSIM
jgi:sulfur-oxidizing protein SoxX